MSRLLVAQRALTVPGWAKDALWRSAQAIPSLDLRFADNKSLVDAVTGASLVTFARASSGTFTGSNGVLQTAATNESRFDHNPTTGESLGLLVEEQRTNLLVQSEDFSVTWALGNTSIGSNSTTSPSGAITADTIIENTLNAQHYVNQTLALPDDTVTTVSVYAKAFTRNWIRVSFITKAGLFPGAWFDLSTGSIGTIVSSPIATSIIAVGNGWYRCSVTADTGSGATTPGVRLWVTNANSIINYTGDGTSGIYFWGAQLEAGAFPTSYIPTTTAAATRAADVASITGTNFSSWYRQDEGSFFCSTFAPKGIVIYGTGDTFDNTQYVTAAASSNVTIRSGGAISALLTAPVSTTGTTNIAHAYAANDFAAVTSGGTVQTDTSGIVPAGQVRLKLGSSAWSSGAGNEINGHIRRLTYWPTCLANNVLQSITK